MAVPKQIKLFVFLLVIGKAAHGSTKETDDAKNGKEEELIQSETKDGKLEIIKRIKKINDDGSYTIGYEADDGSFKIESRDVLGHIKGTYGFVDDQGQIKRVSYTTSNSSEIISKPDLPSVVQRIPIKNRTMTSTRRPTYIFSSTVTTPVTTANSVVQSITKRRTSSTTTSTSKPNYDGVINVNKATIRPSYVTYTSAAPRVLLQGRSTFVDTTETTHIHPVKSEGQLLRPEVVTVKSTDPPSFRQLAFKHLEDEKPVTEDAEPELGGNILRRQSPLPQKDDDFNIQEHVFRLQQSLGHDSTDVYSNSMTTGTPRPLFTTTNRPIVLSTTHIPASVPRPTSPYIRNNVQDLNEQTPAYAETATLQTASVRSTSTPVPVVQIPANKDDTQEPLVAIRQPYNRHAILVPLSHFQGRFVPNNYQRQYTYQQDQYLKETTPKPVVEVEQQQAVVRRLPPPPLRPIPVQVDENGYIRDLPRQIGTPYPVPVPVTTPPERYVDNDEGDNNIDNIQPPVSTKDLQKLLQQLILRQSRLEKISDLTRNPDIYQKQQQQSNPVYMRPEPYYLQRIPASEHNTNGPVQFVQRVPESRPSHNYIGHQQVTLRQLPQHLYEEQYDQQSYRPNRRVARLLPIHQDQQEEPEQYLPSDVREMLLLRMLQLAINPSMPIKDEDFDLEPKSQLVKRMPVRNVEILGEDGTDRRSRMVVGEKRYMEDDDH